MDNTREVVSKTIDACIMFLCDECRNLPPSEVVGMNKAMDKLEQFKKVYLRNWSNEPKQKGLVINEFMKVMGDRL